MFKKSRTERRVVEGVVDSDNDEDKESDEDFNHDSNNLGNKNDGENGFESVQIEDSSNLKEKSSDNGWDDDWGTRGDNIDGDDEVLVEGNSSIHDDDNVSSRDTSPGVDFWNEEKKDAQGREETPQLPHGVSNPSAGSPISPSTTGGGGLELHRSPPIEPAAKLLESPRFGQRSSSSPTTINFNQSF
ncbi:unnamed protein product [[Candida] boidinii]|nr:unnamed protein product [[Candida] boidinii]